MFLEEILSFNLRNIFILYVLFILSKCAFVHMLSSPDEWDNKLFGVSDAEAVKVDPQQRYVLECTHMALEDGGITRSQISDTQTGVYIGMGQI